MLPQAEEERPGHGGFSRTTAQTHQQEGEPRGPDQQDGRYEVARPIPIPNPICGAAFNTQECRRTVECSPVSLGWNICSGAGLGVR